MFYIRKRLKYFGNKIINKKATMLLLRHWSNPVYGVYGIAG